MYGLDVVIADTAGGPIDVGHAKGMVTAKNSAGPIQVSSASGARCESELPWLAYPPAKL